MIDALGVEDVPDPVADGVVDRLQLELAGERLLHAVDQRQLRVPLPRLLDGASPRERRADVLADEREQIAILLRVRMFCVYDWTASTPTVRSSDLSGTPSQSSLSSPISSTSPCSTQLL